MEERYYFVYMLASQRNGTIYTGITSDLMGRVFQHKQGLAPGFTKKYNVTKLVWFEMTNDVAEALQLEKRLKRWHRQWKIELIEKENPEWRDLFEEWTV